MHRRDFSRILAAAAVSALGASAAQAAREPELQPLAPSGRARIYLNQDSVPLNYVMILNETGTLGVDLRDKVPQYDEAGLGAPRLYDDLSRVPLRRRMAKATKVGTVYFWKSTLFVLPDGNDIARMRAAIVHGEKSFEPKPPMMKVNLSNRPDDTLIRSQPLVGEAWQAGGELVLLIGAGTLGELRANR